MEDIEKFINAFRKERHDFMNCVQIIYGYLQLDNTKEAIRYINKIIGENKDISSLYALGDQCFGFCMEKVIKELNQKEIEVDLDVEIDKLYKENFKNQYNKKEELINNIINEIENNKLKFVYIYIFEDELGQSIMIANGESLVNELEWMDDWEEKDSNISDISIHKYVYGNNLAYRLTFL
ncbi:hypothetical protein Z969_05230 [Clostridium novyi A str. 4570]|uniref:SpoOB alpha-helical domain-containing protein n=1 Tax=Clostridium novyi A str. 4570 TaxID=1444290 RepID=A0AA88ZNM1_CLONO|nr:Spo0B domain-containing protein [Clostridium novyi]KGN02486.1 hypothetical protein Z969_05230 [Clostridium novyi A str. 4570]